MKKQLFLVSMAVMCFHLAGHAECTLDNVTLPWTGSHAVGWSATLKIDESVFTDIAENSVLGIYFEASQDGQMDLRNDKCLGEDNNWHIPDNSIVYFTTADTYKEVVLTQATLEKLRETGSEGLEFCDEHYTIKAITLNDTIWKGSFECTSYETTPLSIDKIFFSSASIGHKLTISYTASTSDNGNVELKSNDNILPGTILHTIAKNSGEGALTLYLTTDALAQLQAYGLTLTGEHYTATAIKLERTEFQMPTNAVWGGYFWMEAAEMKSLELYGQAFDNHKEERYMVINLSEESNHYDYHFNVVSAWHEGSDPDYVTKGDANTAYYAHQIIIDLTKGDIGEFATILDGNGYKLWFQGQSTTAEQGFNITSIVMSDTVPLPSLVYTMNGYGYSTFFYEQTYEIPAGITAQTIDGNDGEDLTFNTPLSEYIPANTAVMLSGTPDAVYTFKPAIAIPAYSGSNCLNGTLTDTNIAATEDKVRYILSTNENDQVGWFWPGDSGEGKASFTNAAHKCYLELSGQAAVAARTIRGFILAGGGISTPLIETTSCPPPATKVVIDGQLYIRHNEQVYNIMGQRMK